MSSPLPLFQKRDLDGFCGLFVDNLVQLLSILFFCSAFCGMQGDDATLITAVVLPGAAMSLLAGNLFYAWQAHRLAAKENRTDVTALPYGINTPSLIVYVFFVMAPVYASTKDARAAWQAGLVACFGSGLIELAGAFIAGPIRRVTPRAALLATLAGIAIGFISMIFALKIYQQPLVGFVPLAVVLATLFGRVRFVGGLPGGFIAVLAGTAMAWLATWIGGWFDSTPAWLKTSTMSLSAIQDSIASIGFYMPQWCGSALWDALSNPDIWQPFVTVIVPMGLFNLIGSLQNLESAEAAGDQYAVAPSLAANGIGTILASLFGSCFPTTIYIGHPGWKSLGSGAGYSTLNGLAITVLCFTGLTSLTAAIVPLEAGAAIVLWIGVVIGAQAFTAVPKAHAPAVALALFPAIAAFGATVMLGTFNVAQGTTLQALLEENLAAEVNGFLIHAFITMERGYILVCMIWGAIGVALIDRKYRVAAAWSAVAAVLTWTGIIHAYQVFGGNIVDSLFRMAESRAEAVAWRADDVMVGYLLVTAFFLALPRLAHLREDRDQRPHEEPGSHPEEPVQVRR